MSENAKECVREHGKDERSTHSSEAAIWAEPRSPAPYWQPAEAYREAGPRDRPQAPANEDLAVAIHTIEKARQVAIDQSKMPLDPAPLLHSF